MVDYDVVIIGSGPAGLAAAASARKKGASKVVVLEREDSTGGILNQCIHDGFGLIRYHKQLSGPEYASRALKEALDAGAEVMTGMTVTQIDSAGDGSDAKIVCTVSRQGLMQFRARAVVLGLGCRERTRGALMTPGSRPAGVYTAGVAQNLINTKNIMVGKNVVILGSGDIGLIMARRLTLEGAHVIAVAEIMSAPCGLARNVSQCLNDFGIPLYLSHTVSRIEGKRRLEAVEIARVDENKRVIAGTERRIECDTLILSVGLIPENEVSQTAGVALDGRTNGTLTDEFLQTSVPGIFSCGNSRRVMDLADFVSMQGELAGANAACYVQGLEMDKWLEEKANTMLKGMPPKGSLTCVFCPNGCQITVDEDGSVSGNRCPKGKAFALQERSCPRRILTTTMRVEGGQRPLVSVRSTSPVDLSEMQSLAAELSGIVLKAPVEEGQVVCSSAGNNKVDIIATQSIGL